MPAPIPVAILGFSSFDRRALASYFLLDERPWPRYERVLGADDARLIIADADEPGVVALLYELGRVGDALFIGAQPPADAEAWMMRPIDQVQVLHQLDTLLARQDNPESAPLPLGLPTRLARGALRTIGNAQQLALPTGPARRAADSGPGPLPGPPHGEHAGGRRPARERPRDTLRRPLVPPRALLVDDSEIALHFLRRLLDAYGLDVDVARDSERALDLLAHRDYGFVFIDVDLGEHSREDGLTLCARLQRGRRLAGGNGPVVAMVSASHEAVDQVRGTLAGADAYLGKPLDLLVLDRLLQRQGFFRHRPQGSSAPWPLPRR